jgi:choline dehydrogenase-like flavoprotein
MDHIYLKAEGVGPDVESGGDALGPSRCIYLPRFDLRDGATGAVGRGFGVRVYQSPHGPGQSYFVAAADSEMLPRPENRVTLSNGRDAFGLRTLRIECRHSDEERARAALLAEALEELAAAAEVRLKDPVGGPWTPGSAIHESGTARMGDDPAHSALDPHNQCWDVKGLYVTDGSAFPSQGIQNPTLTILALTARACAHAAKPA